MSRAKLGQESCADERGSEARGWSRHLGQPGLHSRVAGQDVARRGGPETMMGKFGWATCWPGVGLTQGSLGRSWLPPGLQGGKAAGGKLALTSLAVGTLPLSRSGSKIGR